MTQFFLLSLFIGDFSVGLSWRRLKHLLSSNDFHFSLFPSKLGLYFAQLFLGAGYLTGRGASASAASCFPL